MTFSVFLMLPRRESKRETKDTIQSKVAGSKGTEALRLQSATLRALDDSEDESQSNALTQS